VQLVVVGVAVLVASGVLALAACRSQRLSTAVGALGTVIGCALAAAPAVRALGGASIPELRHAWAVPVGALIVGLDPLTAFFLLPLCALSALAAIYGRAYLLGYADRKLLAVPAFFYNLLVASMIVVVVARDGVLFLVGWELMTLASYLLVTFEHEDPAVKRAGWVYLIAAHIGVVCLFFMFLLLGHASGSLEFATLGVGDTRPSVVLALALVGFGIKAGVVPLHVWLPEAHAAAPSHVSALMSGILIKLGIYGILRVLTMLPTIGWAGPVLMILGITGGLVGISLALAQRDLKRVLAYSSIENVGIILFALGLGLWGASHGRAEIAALGFAGGLLHAWNHVVMKGLMFLSAGSVLHGAGTKDLERLGGLMKRMRVTGVLMTIGAIAISGLPPLNGFVSEWLIYLGLMNHGVASRGTVGIVALVTVGIIALIGGLAVICFIRLIGVALLGQPRSEAAAHAHESSTWMLAPMIVLAAVAIGIAVVPAPFINALGAVIGQLGGSAVRADTPLAAASAGILGYASMAVFVALAIGGVLVVVQTRRNAVVDDTWGCGYAAPTARMQYTARSFSETIAERLVPPPLRTRIAVTPPSAIFPARVGFSSETDDPMTKRVYEPLLARWGDRFARLRWLQHGVLHVYLAYIVLVLVVALAWLSLRTWMGA
jgi:formate hydrogenlyase subunit 3/multisubunit Na+/H+ antiporter MnhD subunit